MLLWVVALISGLVIGAYVASGVTKKISEKPSDFKNQICLFSVVILGLAVSYLIAPLVRLLLGTSSWRLFGIYGYTEVFILSFCISALLVVVFSSSLIRKK
jgi:hypothetical protein